MDTLTTSLLPKDASIFLAPRLVRYLWIIVCIEVGGEGGNAVGARKIPFVAYVLH